MVIIASIAESTIPESRAWLALNAASACGSRELSRSAPVRIEFAFRLLAGFSRPESGVVGRRIAQPPRGETSIHSGNNLRRQAIAPELRHKKNSNIRLDNDLCPDFWGRQSPRAIRFPASSFATSRAIVYLNCCRCSDFAKSASY